MSFTTLSSDQLVTVAGGCNMGGTATPPVTPDPATAGDTGSAAGGAGTPTAGGLDGLLAGLLQCLQSKLTPPADSNPATGGAPEPAPTTSSGCPCSGAGGA